MSTDGRTDMTKLVVAFRSITHPIRSHFVSTFSQTKNVSEREVRYFVETLQSAVALNQADSKQRNKIIVIHFESHIMERELKSPEVPRGCQEVKVPRLRDNGPGWW